MKQIIGTYTFSTSAKTITLTDFTTIRLDRLRLITDVTTNKILYNFADSSVATATVATNVITLSALQGGETNTDKLEIDYDTITGDPTYDTPPLANNAAKETGGNLATIATNTTGVATAANQTTGNTSLSSIATNTSNTSSNTSAISTVEGATSDTAVTSDANGTVSGKLRGLVKILADIWDSVNHRIKVDGSGVTQPVSGTVTASAGTNLNTSALALESGGNLATIATNTGNGATSVNQTNGNQQTKLTNGTNVADTLAGDSGYNSLSVNNSTKTYSFSTSSSGAQTLLANTDCRGYAWITVVTTGVGSGLAWNGQFAPNSGGTYISSSKWLSATSATATMSSLGTVVSTIYSSPVISNYFQLNISALTSGTVSGYVILSTMPLTPQTVMMGIISSASTMVPLRSAGSAGTNNGGDNELAAVSYGQYNSSAPTVTTGNYNPLQTDINGRLYVQAPSATGSAVPANAFAIGIQDSGSTLKIAMSAGNGDALSVGQIIASQGYAYNDSGGADRWRNNTNRTTGDSGTKTASFAGATQTNYNARGAYITILLGTVSGTTPTLNAQLQWSPDGGTTWLNLGPATSNLTTSNQNGLVIVYPTRISQSPGTTPADLTSGANVTTALNTALPRTWRLNYTIGGTSPSFAISSVQVNYIV